jgi:glycosyltransferase involved in cell wall biosynthesis
MPKRGAATHEKGGSAFVALEGGAALRLARTAWQLKRRGQMMVSAAGLTMPLNPLQKMLLARADGVLANPEQLAALTRCGIPADRVITLARPFECAPFLASPLARAGAAAHRIAYLGELSPNSGVADFLACVVRWAERFPGSTVEVSWFGRGDLEGVLQAQPVPANLAQSFADIPPRAELAAQLSQCGLLVVPSIAGAGPSRITDAMAAGLPVLGSTRSTAARALVTHGLTGWLFDPLVAGAMPAALATALATDPLRLDVMRAEARARITALLAEHSARSGIAPAAMPDLLAGHVAAQA